MTIAGLLIALILPALAAGRWGTDSRDGRDWTPASHK